MAIYYWSISLRLIVKQVDFISNPFLKQVSQVYSSSHALNYYNVYLIIRVFVPSVEQILMTSWQQNPYSRGLITMGTDRMEETVNRCATIKEIEDKLTTSHSE